MKSANNTKKIFRYFRQLVFLFLAPFFIASISVPALSGTKKEVPNCDGEGICITVIGKEIEVDIGVREVKTDE